MRLQMTRRSRSRLAGGLTGKAAGALSRNHARVTNEHPLEERPEVRRVAAMSYAWTTHPEGAAAGSAGNACASPLAISRARAAYPGEV